MSGNKASLVVSFNQSVIANMTRYIDVTNQAFIQQSKVAIFVRTPCSTSYDRLNM